MFGQLWLPELDEPGAVEPVDGVDEEPEDEDPDDDDPDDALVDGVLAELLVAACAATTPPTPPTTIRPETASAAIAFRNGFILLTSFLDRVRRVKGSALGIPGEHCKKRSRGQVALVSYCRLPWLTPTTSVRCPRLIRTRLPPRSERC